MKRFMKLLIIISGLALIFISNSFVHWNDISDLHVQPPGAGVREEEREPVFFGLYIVGMEPSANDEEDIGEEYLLVEEPPENESESDPDPEQYPDSDSNEIPDTDDALISSYFAQGGLELPIVGASGFAAVSSSLRAEHDNNAEVVLSLSPGDGFTILDSFGDWWYVQRGETTGWIRHRYCFINLPDVLPSIIYDITNAHSSVFRSSGYEIPGVTGIALYQSFGYNPRFGREMFIAPAMYGTALKLADAQRAALANNHTIVLYEAFRPHSTQTQVASSLAALMEENPAVAAGINSPPWNLSWFISTTLSNHQRGAAVDVSLARVDNFERRAAGDFEYTYITNYTILGMPSEVHELSIRAIIYYNPISTTSPTAWIGVPFRTGITQDSAAAIMQRYFTDAGFTPIASEWWHFNDLASIEIARSIGTNGRFHISTIYSIPPSR